MARNRPSPALGACAALVAGALLLTACGSDEETTAPTGDAARPAASEFPAPDGRTLEQIAADEGTESEYVATPANSVFKPGLNRLGFGVFTIEREPVADAEVAIYAAKPDGEALGPFPASAESLAVDAPFQSVSTQSDPDAPDTLFSSEVEMPGNGEVRLMALFKDGDSYTYSALPSAVVGRGDKVPQEGEKAPVIHTETAEDVGGDLTKIDTRQPPSTQHEADFADVVGKEPVVLLFATPALCQSRVCGPVVDIAEQVKSERDDEAAFILQEIFVDNNFDKGVRPQVAEYKLPSEPWLFVIDEDGTISTVIEGAFSEGELNAALDKVSG
jgi:hypothetical protein